MATTVASIFETMEWGPAPEASGPALDWIRAQTGNTGTFGLFIGGRWVAPAAGETFETINPATRAVLARVAQAGAADVAAAVRAARDALPAWAGLP
ncbi:MAG TPA: aldehyde dehydrogenase family protein, partial [Gemmatimonadales bacterium]|nr:aldehyde dehydrogenase family protein [Gemmatimonadales bacterium]